jgi:hypothetical protein
MIEEVVRELGTYVSAAVIIPALRSRAAPASIA